MSRAAGRSVRETLAVTDTVLTTAVFVAVLCVGLLHVRRVLRAAVRRTRKGVLGQLAQPAAVHTVQLTRVTAAWNPAHRGPGHAGPVALRGPGTATYWKDESERVHLLHQPVTGGARHLVSPGPPVVLRPARWAVRLVMTAFFGLLVGGFALGYLASSGSLGDRVLVGLLGALGGLACLPVLVLVVRVARGPGRGTAAPAAAPAPAEAVAEAPVPPWVLAHLESRAASTRRRVPRAWPPALAGALSIAAAVLVLGPSSARAGGWRVDGWHVASEALWVGGVLLLLAALVCLVLRAALDEHRS